MEVVEKSPWEKVDLLVNVVNQIFIGFITIYMSWYTCWRNFTTGAVHAWFVTVGFQFLSAEGILAFYSANSWSSVYSTGTKRHIHWILLVIGSALALTGIFIEIVHVGDEGREHFTTIHGKLGLASTVYLCLNLLTGILAFFSVQFRHWIRPIGLKILHLFLGMTGFVLGMVALYDGIMKLQRRLEYSFVVLLAVICLSSLVLTMLGPLKSVFRHLIQMGLESNKE